MDEQNVLDPGAVDRHDRLLDPETLQRFTRECGCPPVLDLQKLTPSLSSSRDRPPPDPGGPVHLRGNRITGLISRTGPDDPSQQQATAGSIHASGGVGPLEGWGDIKEHIGAGVAAPGSPTAYAAAIDQKGTVGSTAALQSRLDGVHRLLRHRHRLTPTEELDRARLQAQLQLMVTRRHVRQDGGRGQSRLATVHQDRCVLRIRADEQVAEHRDGGSIPVVETSGCQPGGGDQRNGAPNP